MLPIPAVDVQPFGMFLWFNDSNVITIINKSVGTQNHIWMTTKILLNRNAEEECHPCYCTMIVCYFFILRIR